MNQNTYAFWLNQLQEAQQAFNACTNYIITNAIPLTIKSVHVNTYHWMRTDFPILPAQSVIKIYKDAIASIQSIKSNKHYNSAIPQRTNLVMRLDKRLYSSLRLDDITISSGQPHKRELIPFILYPKAEYMLKNYIAHDPTLFVKDNNVCYKYELGGMLLVPKTNDLFKGDFDPIYEYHGLKESLLFTITSKKNGIIENYYYLFSTNDYRPDKDYVNSKFIYSTINDSENKLYKKYLD